MKPSTPKAYHIIISGRVQGISFRHYAKEKARLYGISGWVRNLITGQIEIFAQGSNPQLDMFMEWCGHGPEGCEIDDIDTSEHPLEEDLDEFDIRS